VEANSPSNLAIAVQLALMWSSAAAVVSAEFCGGAAPLTVKLEPGSAWNTAPSAVLLPPLFSADNFFQNPTNVFPGLLSINMMCLPNGDGRHIVGMRPVTGPDDWPLAS